MIKNNVWFTLACFIKNKEIPWNVLTLIKEFKQWTLSSYFRKQILVEISVNNTKQQYLQKIETKADVFKTSHTKVYICWVLKEENLHSNKFSQTNYFSFSLEVN